MVRESRESWDESVVSGGASCELAIYFGAKRENGPDVARRFASYVRIHFHFHFTSWPYSVARHSSPALFAIHSYFLLFGCKFHTQCADFLQFEYKRTSNLKLTKTSL